MKPAAEKPARIVAAGLALALLALVACNTTTAHLSKRWNEQAPRDAETGILIGAEELDLGPADAPVGILLTHGFIGGSSNFGELPARLAAEGYRVRALRLPGHGATPEELAQVSPDELRQHVMAEARTLAEAHETLILIGHSMGGTISTLTASALPEIDALVLAAPYFGVTHKWYYILRPETWTRLTGWAIERVYKGESFKRVKRTEARPDILSYKWVPSKASATLMQLGRTARAPETLGAIDCPTLVLHGPDDNAAAYAKTKQAFDTIPAEDKTFITLENSDHHIFYDYQREEAIESILTFIQRVIVSPTQ